MMRLRYMRCDGSKETLDTRFTQGITQIQNNFYVSGLAAELFFSLPEVLAQICAR